MIIQHSNNNSNFSSPVSHAVNTQNGNYKHNETQQIAQDNFSNYFSKGTLDNKRSSSILEAKDYKSNPLEEAKKLIEYHEQDINKKFNALSQQLVKKSFIESWIVGEKWIYNNALDIRKNVRDVDQFLSFILPMENVHIYQHLQNFENFMELVNNYLQTINQCLDILTIFYQDRIIRESQKIVNALKITYKTEIKQTKQEELDLIKKLKVSNLNELKKIQETIKNWDSNIKNQIEISKVKKFNFALSFSRYSLKKVKESLTEFKLFKSLKFVSHLKNVLSLAGESIGIIISGILWKKTLNDKKSFNLYVNGFNEWRNLHSNPVTISFTEEKSNDFQSLSKYDTNIKSENVQKIYDHLIQEFLQQNNLEEIRIVLAKYKINHIPTKISTKEEFVDYFKKTIAYQEAIINQAIQNNEELKALFLQHDAQSSPFSSLSIQQLIDKRELAIQLRMRLIESNSESRAKFNEWVTEQKNKDKNELETQNSSNVYDLRTYVNHQQTLEITVKNALKQMINNKIELEKKFVNFKTINSTTLFTASIVGFTFTLASTILGFLSISAGGIGFILLALSAISLPISLGFFIAGFILAKVYKPNVNNKFLDFSNIKIILYSLLENVYNYKKLNSQSKNIKAAKLFVRLFSISSKPEEDLACTEAKAKFIQANQTHTENKNKAKKWTEKIQVIKNKLKDEEWKDFAVKAKLRQKSKQKSRENVRNMEDAFKNLEPTQKTVQNYESYDDLQIMQEMLKKMDLNLISPEMQGILEYYMEVDLEKLQNQINNSENIKENLRKFFILNDGTVISFIKQQQAIRKAQLISLVKSEEAQT